LTFNSHILGFLQSMLFDVDYIPANQIVNLLLIHEIDQFTMRVEVLRTSETGIIVLISNFIEFFLIKVIIQDRKKSLHLYNP